MIFEGGLKHPQIPFFEIVLLYAIQVDKSSYLFKRTSQHCAGMSHEDWKYCNAYTLYYIPEAM